MSAEPDGFDPVIHVPVRLRLCCLLAGVDRMAFPVVRSTLDVSASVLSKQTRLLQEAGVVAVSKERQDADGNRAWLSLTERGRAALSGHLAALAAIADAAGGLPDQVATGDAAP